MRKIIVLFGLLLAFVTLSGCAEKADLNDYCLITVEGGTGGGNYKIGDIVEITATIPSGKQFMYWTIDGEMISSNDVYRFEVEKTVTLIANFSNAVAASAVQQTFLI